MNRIRSYRWIEGINQDELGKLLGISPQLVSAIESGRRSPTCDIAPLGYGSSKIESAEMTEPLHRQRAATHVASTRRAKELLRLAGEAFAGLQQVLPERRKNKLEPLGPVHSDFDITEYASEVRVAALEQEECGPIKNLNGRRRAGWHMPDPHSRPQRNRWHLLMGRRTTCNRSEYR